ncbi:hypothetical protein JCM19232_5177 [Vibrio ishigakensis]|uniref:Uncharacterized protein n=1 Tax=Vibrio ishigakensis TaxID=1481914 RepID=A0A0B8PGG3_9VIBR|nr:hypothetical protein JCM19232_5177 [Vibrio ishigakensis]
MILLKIVSSAMIGLSSIQWFNKSAPRCLKKQLHQQSSDSQTTKNEQ